MTNRTILRGAVLSLAVAHLAACESSRCQEGAARCRGNVAENCTWLATEDHTLVWDPENCRARSECVLLAEPEMAFCALSAAPDRRCPDDDWSRQCVGGTAIECVYGYLVAADDCGAADLCVETDVGPVCALAPDRDPRCDRAGFDDACDGSLAITCEDGWRIAEYDCGAASLCLEGADRDFFAGAPSCLASLDPDPRCDGVSDELDPEANFCEGDTHLFCDPSTGRMLVEPCSPGGCRPNEVGRSACVYEAS